MYNSKSLNDRLKNYSKEHGVPVDRVRTTLGLERLIARLMQDTFLYEHLVFGGGFVLYKEADSDRYTRDVDAVINGVGHKELISRVEQSLSIDLNDGFWFGNLNIEELTIEDGYGGLRFKVQYKAGLPMPVASEQKRLERIHLDVAIGPDLEKSAKLSSLKSTLDIYNEVEWKVYPIEFICAEKIHSLLKRKSLNTRGKDIYDLDFLLEKSDQRTLVDGLKFIFQNRDFHIDSFKSVLETIDTSNLEDSFKKAQFKSSPNEFSKCWLNIVSRLQELDRFL
jgi:hypothetical protein